MKAYHIREKTTRKPELILRKLVITSRTLEPHEVDRREATKTARSIEELENFKELNWYWLGTQNHNVPYYRKIAAVRFLYDLLKVRIYRNWKLIPISENIQKHNVNPYFYKLANGYEDNFDVPQVPEDVQDVIDLLNDNTPLQQIEKYYDIKDIERACKILGRNL